MNCRDDGDSRGRGEQAAFQDTLPKWMTRSVKPPAPCCARTGWRARYEDAQRSIFHMGALSAAKPSTAAAARGSIVGWCRSVERRRRPSYGFWTLSCLTLCRPAAGAFPMSNGEPRDAHCDTHNDFARPPRCRLASGVGGLGQRRHASAYENLRLLALSIYNRNRQAAYCSPLSGIRPCCWIA